MSFILTHHTDENALIEAKEKQGWSLPICDLGRFSLAVAQSAVCYSHAERGSVSYGLIGDFANHQELRQMLCMFDSSALTATHAGLASMLIARFGYSGLALVDGAFILFSDDAETDTLIALTDVLGQYPLYVAGDRSPWIAPSPRLAALQPDYVPEFFALDKVLDNDKRADDFVPISNMTRLKPGTAFQLTRDGQGHLYASSKTFHQLGIKQDRNVSLKDAIGAIEGMLIPAIRNAVQGDGTTVVPLSGGVDSSIVAAFGARFTDLKTVAIGTSRSNEYKPSKLVADHVGTAHSQMEISTEEILQGLFHSVFNNGIFDGYAAEVQASIFAFMARLEDTTEQVVTGYGADLLMGGTLVPSALPIHGVNRELWEQVYRTRWSSEFSPVGANSMGFQIRHPFWTPRFLGYALDLSPALKVSADDVKIALRFFAEDQNILPDATVWRKKIAIHHGSSVEDILSDALGSKLNARAKETFAYGLFCETVSGTVTPENYDPKDALMRSKSMFENS